MPATVNGGAIYTEYSAEGIEVYEEPYEYLRGLLFAIWRAWSLGLDNSIHAKGSLESVETRMNERVETQKG